MKKLIASLTMLTLCGGVSIAQNNPTDSPDNNKRDRNELTTPAAGQDVNNRRDADAVSQKDNKNRGDKQMSAGDFVNKATIVHQYEIEAGELAIQNASNEEVKAYAESMVEAHEELKNDLIELENEGAVTASIPTELDEKHRKLLEELRNAKGDKFDQKYLQQQMKAHQQAEKLFSNAQNTVQGEELQEYAGNNAEAVRDHLDQLKEIMDDFEKNES